MADTPMKGLALLLLGKKPKAEAKPAEKTESAGPSDASVAACQGIIDALQQGTGDAEALNEALEAWFSARS